MFGGTCSSDLAETNEELISKTSYIHSYMLLICSLGHSQQKQTNKQTNKQTKNKNQTKQRNKRTKTKTNKQFSTQNLLQIENVDPNCNLE